ncbi:MAG TPA: response regulator transcription factor [Candidatus Krumholzibacteria bacterium]
MTAKIRVLLIEDNRLLREGIAEILRANGGFLVDARADGNDSAGQLTDGRAPDVILLDLGLEKEHSLKLMTSLRERFPEARVVAMDILPDQSDLVEFVGAGGSGFILKNAPVDDYVKTIKAVASGTTILPAMLTRSLFTQIVESALKKGDTLPDHATRLTRREREIVDLISEGMSNKEIAQRLHIATFTVKSHVHNVLEKLELNTRLQIAAFVRDGRER